ncbi:hypothetical protein V9K92_01890 [Phyllobacterium sp. CCNWLW109]|uniref:hypothetical protein n=1 Tax=Phyllobacterium sp. CCNWLW109 TaxID=3127479 RepID=UPI003077926A
MNNRKVLAGPGWSEIIVALACLSVLAIACGLLSGIGGLGRFIAALSFCLRSWRAFGVRRTTKCWLSIAVGLVFITFLMKSLAILACIMLTGNNRTPQDVYATGTSANAVAATVFLSVLTPLGKEFLFCGVITAALLRFGPLRA